jgi:hypothetical protein
MIHAGKRSRFAPQAAPRIYTFVCLANSLNCDCSFQPFIPALVHNTHATFTDLAPDTIVADGGASIKTLSSTLVAFTQVSQDPVTETRLVGPLIQVFDLSQTIRTFGAAMESRPVLVRECAALVAVIG